MPSLKEVKNRITSVVSTQQITKAMKMVAAAKLRRSQERIIQMRPFAQKLNALLKNLSAAQMNADGDNWYSVVREEKKILIWGKTYPELSTKDLETVCTGGVTEDGRPIRL